MTFKYIRSPAKWLGWLLFSIALASSNLYASDVSALTETSCNEDFSLGKNPDFEAVVNTLQQSETSVETLYLASDLVIRYAESSLWCEAEILYRWTVDYMDQQVEEFERPFYMSFLVLSAHALNKLDEAWEMASQLEDAQAWVIDPVLISWAERGDVTALQNANSTATSLYGQQLAASLQTLARSLNGESSSLNELLERTQLLIQSEPLNETDAQLTMALATALARVGREEQALQLLDFLQEVAAKNLHSSPEDYIYFESLKVLSVIGHAEVALENLDAVMLHDHLAQNALSDILLEYAASGFVAEAWELLSMLNEPTLHARTAAYILKEGHSDVSISTASELYQQYANNENPLSFLFGASLVGFKAKVGDVEGALKLLSELPYQGARRAFLLAEYDIQLRLKNTH